MKRIHFLKHFAAALIALSSLPIVPSPAYATSSPLPPYSQSSSKKYSPEWEETAKVAQAGDADAQYRLGCMYMNGDGIECSPADAFYWFKKAATNGNADAMLQVGNCFRNGYGVIADNRIAAENYWRAAEAGNDEGAYKYAEMLRDGTGVPQDKAKAWYWFDKASKNGYADSATQAHTLKSYSKAASISKSKSNSPSKSKSTATKKNKTHRKSNKR